MNKLTYLDRMNITVWHPKAGAALSALPNDINISWASLKNRAEACTACPLSKTRKNVVFGAGHLKAKLMLIGEAPGAQEDQQGLPFVGPAGQLLTAMLKAIQLDREEVYIANILKCRPPNNRDPEISEVNECSPFLTAQIELIQPKLLLALGRIAAHFLLNTDTPLSRLRGQLYHYGKNKTPLMLTYHPAYLLRNPADKAKAWEDLKKVRDFL